MADSKEAQFQPAMTQQIQLFTSADGQAQLQVALEHDTVWLSLQQLTELFARDKSVISRHLKNIFDSNELQREAVVAKKATTKNCLVVRQEGARQVRRRRARYGEQKGVPVSARYYRCPDRSGLAGRTPYEI